MRIFVVLCTVFALALPLGACCDSKIAECNSMIETINKGMPDFSKVGNSDDMEQGAKDMRSIAKDVDKLRADVEKLELATPELVEKRKEYTAMLSDISKYAVEFAEVIEGIKKATDAKDLDKLKGAEKKLDEVNKKFQAAVNKESPIIDGINGFCTGG